MRRDHDTLTAAGFADQLARTLERRTRMLKLMSMNLYDMEGNSRMENLVDFKRAYRDALAAVERLPGEVFPLHGAAGPEGVPLTPCSPSSSGYTPTQRPRRSRAAMEAVGVRLPPLYRL